MKKILLIIMVIVASMTTSAQNKITEPEYDYQIAVLNADSTLTFLQKEKTSVKAKSSMFGMIPVPGSGLLDRAKVNLIVKGTTSATIIPGKNIDLVIRLGEGMAKDPKSLIGIIKFNVKKKHREYKMADVGLIGGADVSQYNSVDWNGRKYGNSSYLISLRDLEPGEYGVLAGGDSSMIVTFSIK